MMHTQPLSTEQLFLEIEQLRRELADLKQDKADLEILLETTTTHADTIEIQLQESNKQLKAEIVERQRAEALLKAFAVQLQSLVEMVSQEKADLQILLETATEHGDLVEELLFDKAQEVIRESQRKLVQFLEAVPVGVGILDAQGKPYYGNRIAKQLVGKRCVPSATVEDLSEAYQVYRAGTISRIRAIACLECKP
jgi:adenylate cyclase